VARDATAARAPVEHARKLVQMLPGHFVQRAIHPMVVGSAGNQESHWIAIADDAKPPIFVRQVRLSRRIRCKPRIAPSFHPRRIRDDAPDFKDAVRIGLGHFVDRAFETAIRRTVAMPEHGAHVGARQRVSDPVEALAVDPEPAVGRLVVLDAHRPAGGRDPRTVDRHLVDVPGLRNQARHQDTCMHH
jgi:hypothetical protein